jgi:hypothetical protein
MYGRVSGLVCAAILGGALASAGENMLTPEVSVGLDLGGMRVGVAGADWSALNVSPYAEVKRTGNGFNFGLRFRGIFSSDSDFTEDGIDCTGECDGFALNGYAGWGFNLGAGWTLSAFGGLGYRSIDAGFDAPDVDYEYDVSVSALTLDLGVGLRGELTEQLAWTTTLTFGPVIVGSVDADARWFVLDYSASDDVEAGFFTELRTGLDIKLRDNLFLGVGLVFEAFGVDVDVDDDDDLDGLAYYTFAANIGVTWKF